MRKSICGWFLAALAGSAAAATPPAHDGPGFMRRIIRHFDFEEGELAPPGMPINFYRHRAEAEGFPMFGRMGLSNDRAVSGRWSFRFDTAGGSMSARVPTGILPVLPGTAYRVSVRVATADLNRSRVRLVSWMHDATDEVIPSTVSTSRAILAESGWETLAVTVGPAPAATPGEAEAAHLVVELQLLQPRAWRGDAGGTQPLLDDVAGTVWFDDVVVRMLPQIELSTGRAVNVIAAPQHPQVEVLIEDLASERLTATLTLLDVDGRPRELGVVMEEAGRHTIPLPIERYGWYRVVLDVTGDSGPVDRRTLDLAYVPPPAPPIDSASSLAVIAPPVATSDLALLPELLSRLQSKWVVLPLADPGPTDDRSTGRLPAIRDTLERLLAADVEIVLGLDDRLTVGSAADGEESVPWMDRMSELLINFGLRVRRWRIDLSDPADREAAIAAVQRFVAEPVVILPWPGTDAAASSVAPAWHVPPPDDGPASVAPPGGWPTGPDRTLVTIGRVAGPARTPRDHVNRVVSDGLRVWRQDGPRPALEAPWQAAGPAGDRIDPDPAFGAWRQLQLACSGRRFAGELDLSDDVVAWIMAGSDERSTALAVWRRDTAPPGPVTVAAYLGDTPITQVDVFGNRTAIAGGPMHAFVVGGSPGFIEGIDLAVAQFRRSVRIDPAVAPSAHRVQEFEIVLDNPWKSGVSGTIRFDESDEWRLTPRAIDFTISGDDSVRLPVSLVFARSVVAGTKRIDATVRLLAEREHTLRTRTTLNVGWPDVEVVPVCTVEGGDLLVTLTVTNHGETSLVLDAFVLGRAAGRRQRPIGSLPAGETTVRAFRLKTYDPHGSLRAGVTERDGAGRLNLTIDIAAQLAGR